jgi:hypothetical protein
MNYLYVYSLDTNILNMYFDLEVKLVWKKYLKNKLNP